MAAIRLMPTNFDFGGNITGKLLGMYRPSIIIDLAELDFHIPNFPNYHGNVIKSSTGGLRSGRMELHADVWSIIIDNLDGTDVLTKSLKENGGHAITHTGKLKSHDNAPFQLSEAEAIMECLSFYLSFISGRWSPPILWVGKQSLDSKNIQIIPANLRLDSWKSTNSWCNINGIKVANDIRALFPSFLNKFKAEHELFRLSVSWYLEVLSDDLVSDSRIILTQAALELLALSIPPLYGQKAKGKAEHRLRGLLQLVVPTVSLAVPSSLARLTAVLDEEPAKSWNKSNSGHADCASVIVSVRNLIAHPARTLAEKGLLRNTMALYEASQLGVWFLEVVLLGWLSYSGRYRSRLKRFGWAGEGEPFPSPSADIANSVE